jgi:hypothetical protein
LGDLDRPWSLFPADSLSCCPLGVDRLLWQAL